MMVDVLREAITQAEKLKLFCSFQMLLVNLREQVSLLVLELSDSPTLRPAAGPGGS